MIRVINAAFVKSSSTIAEAADESVMEVAFLGRSNVGKSSLINALCSKKQLAKSSSTPGKTQLINFFDIIYENEEKSRFNARFVDLPGFGYAKVSKEKKRGWEEFLNKFIKERLSIRAFIHLIDARHTELDIDKSVNSYINSILRADQKVLNIYTKVDKLTQKERSELLKQEKNPLLVSVLKKYGIHETNEAIFNLLFKKEI
ncbi:MAG: ribosome biogenesis GTP-binding protein YihA/YsxC [Campylobacteraceae bacterium]|nr:ribosome biogenesis GTP-binding protein YihA/YsxC [Campylobacteraceae bacterium]